MEKNEGIYLRPIREDDTADIIRWRNSAKVKQFFIQQDDFTEESHLNWLSNYVNKGKAVQFIIVDKKSDRSIGSVYIKDIDMIHKKAEYGIFIGEEQNQGKGYGTEAARLMIDYAFNILKLHRIYLRAYTDNDRAIASYKKAGFEVEGVLKDDVFVRGKYRDMTWMSIINQAD